MKNNTIVRSFTVVSLVLLVNLKFSFAQEILWEKSYGGMHSEYLFDAQPTLDYGFILAGSSLSGKTGNKQQHTIQDLDYWIWKMDEKGDMDWQKSFGGFGKDLLQSIQNTKDGGFILAGTSTSMKAGDKKKDGFGQEDFWIIKLDAAGEEQWQKTLGGSGKDLLQEIHQTRDGGYIIGGSSNSNQSLFKSQNSFGSLDYWVVKLDNSGNIEWERSYGGKYSDILESIIPTKDQGFLVGGWSNSPESGNKTSPNFGDGDYWVLKLDRNGQVEWQNSYGGEQDDHLYVVVESLEGGYIVGGNSKSRNSGNKEESNGKGVDFWVIKLTDTGLIEWESTYDFGETDVLTSLTENEDGTLLIGGYAQSETLKVNRSDKKGVNDYVALKVDRDGYELWRKSVGSSGKDILRKLVKTRDGSYLLAGTSKGEVSRDKNSNHGRHDFWVVKLGNEEEDKEKERFIGLEAFPNPSNSYTNIIVNHDFESGHLSLYDLNGRLVNHFPITGRTIPVNLENLSVGIYIATLVTNVSTESVKIIKSF